MKDIFYMSGKAKFEMEMWYSDKIKIFEQYAECLICEERINRHEKTYRDLIRHFIKKHIDILVSDTL
mgnify:CR=1 FL=1